MHYYNTRPRTPSPPARDVSAQARTWLEHIPPPAVLHTASQTVQQRLLWASTPENRQALQAVLDALQAHQSEALAYAQSVID